MRAGELRHRVEIQKPIVTVDGLGESVPTWQTVTTVHASVQSVRAYENVRARITNMETAFLVKLRYTDEVTPERRFLWEGKELYVDGITDVDGRRREMRVNAFSRTEVATNG
ncbi:MAG TPA: phage head closure protein [Tepidisphaeraceae bacterium]|nr:phage head closure protein [Tepidisphaeraceae bacterium]